MASNDLINTGGRQEEESESLGYSVVTFCYSHFMWRVTKDIFRPEMTGAEKSLSVFESQARHGAPAGTCCSAGGNTWQARRQLLCLATGEPHT